MSLRLLLSCENEKSNLNFQDFGILTWLVKHLNNKLKQAFKPVFLIYRVLLMLLVWQGLKVI